MISSNMDCRRIELALAKVFKGARIGCAWQMDTRDFLGDHRDAPANSNLSAYGGSGRAAGLAKRAC